METKEETQIQASMGEAMEEIIKTFNFMVEERFKKITEELKEDLLKRFNVSTDG